MFVSCALEERKLGLGKVLGWMVKLAMDQTVNVRITVIRAIIRYIEVSPEEWVTDFYENPEINRVLDKITADSCHEI